LADEPVGSENLQLVGERREKETAPGSDEPDRAHVCWSRVLEESAVDCLRAPRRCMGSEKRLQPCEEEPQ